MSSEKPKPGSDGHAKWLSDLDDVRDHRPRWNRIACRRIMTLGQKIKAQPETVLSASALIMASERDDLPPPRISLSPTGCLEIDWINQDRQLWILIRPRTIHVREIETSGHRNNRLVMPWIQDWRRILDWFQPPKATPQTTTETLDRLFGEEEPA